MATRFSKCESRWASSCLWQGRRNTFLWLWLGPQRGNTYVLRCSTGSSAQGNTHRFHTSINWSPSLNTCPEHPHCSQVSHSWGTPMVTPRGSTLPKATISWSLCCGAFPLQGTLTCGNVYVWFPATLQHYYVRAPGTEWHRRKECTSATWLSGQTPPLVFKQQQQSCSERHIRQQSTQHWLLGTSTLHCLVQQNIDKGSVTRVITVCHNTHLTQNAIHARFATLYI